MNPNKPKLERVVFTFVQESNCVDNQNDDWEELEVRCESSLGIDYDNDCFFILKTEQWSVDSKREFDEMLSRIGDAIKAALVNNPHYDEQK
jgi:hypothetical protein